MACGIVGSVRDKTKILLFLVLYFIFCQYLLFVSSVEMIADKT